ncbi:MAG: nucleoside monophosphate kinase [Pseudomonadota bacterium]
MAKPLRNIVVTGKSGAGKQPRIDVLVEAFGLTQLSTGNIFRAYLGAFKKVRDAVDAAAFYRGEGFAPDAELQAALAPACATAGIAPADAALGLKAARYVDGGLFVPDDITNELLASAFKAAGGAGLALDGYPRTPDQSRFLLELVREAGTGLDLILLVDNDDEAIVARTIGRRICPDKDCAKVYHLEFKPPRDGRFCKACGAEVIHRSDDTEAKIRMRLSEFQAKAVPAIQVLKDAGVPMVVVPGNLPVFTDEAVRASVMDALAPVLEG